MYDVIDRAALKAKARELMREGKVPPVKMSLLHLGIVFLMSLAIAVVSAVSKTSDGGLSLIAVFIGILALLMNVVLSAGYTCYCLGIWRGEEMPYASLFDGFSFAGKVIGLELIVFLFTYLGLMLFIIPGIVIAYRYSFAIYNLCLNPELGIMEALNLSKQQTNGYKMQLFTLQLSFLGWAFLAAAPQSIGEALQFAMPSTLTAILALVLSLATLAAQVFLNPYMHLSNAGFYLQATTPFAPEEETTPPPPPEV